MKRVVILGSSGSGKTFLARRLSALLGLGVHHLDTYYWQPEWREPDPQAFAQLNRDIVSRDSWIVEGNYSATRQEATQVGDGLVNAQGEDGSCLWLNPRATLTQRF